MAPNQPATLRIQGKSFDFSYMGPRTGGFVRVVEKGRRLNRQVVVPATMARWICEILGSPFVRLNRSERVRRFGRLLGRVRVQSNSKGRFLEIALVSRGRTTVVFVPSESGVDRWLGFREVLRSVVDGSKGGGLPESGGGPPTSRSGDREVEGSRTCTECRRPWPEARGDRQVGQPRRSDEAVEENGVSSEARELEIGSLRGVARAVVEEVAREVACEVAREVARVMAREMAREMRVTAREAGRELSVGLERGTEAREVRSSSSGPVINLALDLGQLVGSVSRVPGSVEGGMRGDSGVAGGEGELVWRGTQQETATGGGSVGEGFEGHGESCEVGRSVKQGSGQQGGNVVGGNEGKQSDMSSSEEEDDSLYGEGDFVVGDELLLDELRKGYDREEWGFSVPETPMVDLQDVSLFNEEGECSNGLGLRKDGCAQNGEVMPSQNPSAQKEGEGDCGDGLLPAPRVTGPTLGSVEADARGNALAEALGITFVDSMGKGVALGGQVYSRKKNKNRELERLKSTINYDGRGLKSGFLNRH